MNKKKIKDLALSNGFKLKEQPSGEMDLNPYVYDFADALLAKANERVKEIEGQLQLTMLTTHEASFESDYGKKRLSKFAIDKKIEAVNQVLDLERFDFADRPLDFGVRVESIEIILRDLEIELNSEQLRKEQE